jgi:hypothetical protein
VLTEIRGETLIMVWESMACSLYLGDVYRFLRPLTPLNNQISFCD